MTYYIIAGEASGDLHGSNLMKALLKYDSTAQFRFWGGDLMQQVSSNLVVHYKARQFMLFDAILNLRTILGHIKLCKKDISTQKPDIVILIDNSGFNLRIAKWAKQNGYAVHYYISPQVWASRASRVKKIKRYVDEMYVILPFEKAFYAKFNLNVHFVGHPLIDAIAERQPVDETRFRSEHGLNNKPIIALLPGSRKQEISKMLHIMLSVVPSFEAYQFVIAGAPSQDIEFYKSFIKQSNVGFISNNTYSLLSIAYAALVTSGTATLETALFKVPQVVCYKTNPIAYFIAKRIITLQFISLVNLIMNKEVVTELIQSELNPKRLRAELKLILNLEKRKQLFEDYHEIEEKLGGKGASENIAKLIVANACLQSGGTIKKIS